MTLPLAGRRVVVTRSSEQAGTLAERLVARGAEPVVVPLVRIERVGPEVARLAGLALDDVRWVVVTSPNGAAVLHETRGSAAGGAGSFRVAAVGSTTAAVLREQGWSVDLVPARQSGADLVAAMPEGTGEVIVVQAEGAEPTVAVGLEAKGWTVTVVRAYRTVPVTPDEGARADALGADALLLASGSAARSWQAAFGSSVPSLVVAIGPQTADAARSAGVRIDAVADEHSLDGLVAELERHLGS